MDITTLPDNCGVEEERKKMDVTKKAKSKAKKVEPMKVVYISNPMKFKTSPSQFRALVQELTGQDASDLPDPTKFIFDTDGCDLVSGLQTVPDAPPTCLDDDDDDIGNDDDDDDSGDCSLNPSAEMPERQDHGPSSTHQSFEDDHFVSDDQMMLDGFSCFWPSESYGKLDVLRSSYYD